MPLLATEGVTLHFQTLGHGSDLVLIHGLGANLAFWYWGPGRLMARRFHVLTYDLRGHGRSSMPASGYTLTQMSNDLAALLDHLGIARAHIVGHSYGARIALCFAGRFAERTSSLTVVDTQIRALQPPLRLSEWPHWPRWKAQLLATGHSELPADDAVIDFRLLARFSEAAAPRGGGLFAAGGRPLSVRNRDMGERGGRRWLRLLETTSAAEELADERPLDAAFLGAIRVPTLLLYGRYSHCLPSSEGLLSLIPEAERIIIPDAGHFLPAVKPVLFARAVKRFVSDGVRLGGEAARRSIPA